MVIPTVDVAGLAIADLRREEVVDQMRELIGSTTVSTAYGVHVSGLLARSDDEYTAGIAESDLSYADGISLVILARISGAKRITRAPLTDIGHSLLQPSHMSRPGLRVALIGGPPGLSNAAGKVLSRLHSIDVCYTTNGYHEVWGDQIRSLTRAQPAIVFVGMGTPQEVRWIGSHRPQLPPALYVTVGGWFGHLTGRERRAPLVLQRAGFEWLWRMAQRPKDLAPRYLHGAIAVAREIPAALQARWRKRVGRGS